MISDAREERAVLGACLVSGEELGKVAEILKAEDFYDPNNRKAYEICLYLYNSGGAADLVSFQAEAKNRNEYERMGGQAYILELMRDAAALENVKYHAKMIKNLALRRRIEDAGKRITLLAQDFEEENIVRAAEGILLESAEVRENSGGLAMQIIAPAVFAELNEIWAGRKKNRGFFTGFLDLDMTLGGFQPGTLNIIAARPSMGKTALALNIAQFGNCRDRPGSVLFFSLEMSSKQLTYRMLSAQSGISLTDVMTGSTPEKLKILERALKEVQRLNIHINDCSGLTAAEFRTESRRFKMRHPDLALIVVDYLQLMEGSDKKSLNRQYEMAEITRVMKLTASELNCPVVALSQLSRETERQRRRNRSYRT